MHFIFITFILYIVYNRKNHVHNGFWHIKVHKTNTALLLKISRPQGQEPENVEVEEFGYSAERRYSNIMSGELSDDEKDKFHLFKKFKLMLYDVRNLYIFKNDCFYRCLTVCRWPKVCKIVVSHRADNKIDSDHFNDFAVNTASVLEDFYVPLNDAFSLKNIKIYLSKSLWFSQSIRITETIAVFNVLCIESIIEIVTDCLT